LVRELTGHGYAEHKSSGAPRSRPAPAAEEAGLSHLESLLEDDGSAAEASPVLSRLATPPGAKSAAEEAPKKKKKSGKKKKRKKGEAGDALDKPVLAGIGAVGALIVAFAGYMAYDILLKPASIIGVWRGSRLDFETGGPMAHTKYDLILDDQSRASLTLQEK